MKVFNLINAYANYYTTDIAIVMNDEVNTKVFVWSAKDNRHPDDGSYSNVNYYIPDAIANAEVVNFEIIPQYASVGNEVVKIANNETLYITIETYSDIYRIIESDNYPFI